MSRRATGCFLYRLIALAAVCLLGLGCDTVLEADPTADGGPSADAGPAADAGSITDILTGSNRSTPSCPSCPLNGRVSEAVGIGSAQSCSKTWSVQDVPYRLEGIWGSGPTDVYAVGWATSSDAWEIGEPLSKFPKILHWDGSAWTSSYTVLPQVHFGYSWEWPIYYRAVWGSSAQDVFVSGTDKVSCCAHCIPAGYILHFDGKSWHQMNTPILAHHISGLWGSGPTDVFAVGRRCANCDSAWVDEQIWDGVVMHYDGTTWSVMLTNDNYLNDVWGSGPDDVLAVGDNGLILHYDGTGWTQTNASTKAGTKAKLYDVWGSGPDDVFVVGEGGTFLHYDGTGWTPITTGIGVPVLGVWGRSPTDVWAVAGADPLSAILHYDGKGWSTTCWDVGFFQGFNIWSSGPSDVYIMSSEAILHLEP